MAMYPFNLLSPFSTLLYILIPAANKTVVLLFPSDETEGTTGYEHMWVLPRWSVVWIGSYAWTIEDGVIEFHNDEIPERRPRWYSGPRITASKSRRGRW